ncbi:recombinase RecA [Polaromonas sp. C04]|nr:recombinase RecA [Polaromonas sp. C04]
MFAQPHWHEGALPSPGPSTSRHFNVAQLPGRVASAIWRGSELGSAQEEVVESGFAALDAELPGGGWPLRALIEVLQPQPTLCEWRLLGASLRRVTEAGGQLLLVSPPKHPHLPGLLQHGLRANQMVRLDARAPAERLWATEQLVKANPAGAILAWLPQARQEQLRRLQVHAQSCDALVFLFRPAAAQFDASPAPLRVLAELGADWQLKVEVFKRRGPPQERPISLFSIPDSLAGVLTPRLLRPSQFLPSSETPHVSVLGSSAREPTRVQLVSH